MFRLFGFDVRVRAGFMIFLGLIVFIYQDRFGLWLGASIAAFTLLHELGHAVAARSAGAEASISLDFMAGYTSFRPSVPLSRLRRASISAAGPLTQIVISVAVLIALGVNPLSVDNARQTDATAAIWWAGPMIGLLNLIPVLPLDGGHLAQTALEIFIGKRAFRVMAIASLIMTASAGFFMFASGRGDFGIFIFFLLMNQLQLVQMTSPKRMGQPIKNAHDAESAAWLTGRPGMLEPGQRLSPWYQAHRCLAKGDEAGAVRSILDDLASTSEPRWTLAAAANRQQLKAIVDVLPADLPVGNPYGTRVLADVMLAVGYPQRAGSYAAEAYGRHRTSILATTVARAAASMGDDTNALLWLAAAKDSAVTENEVFLSVLARVMDTAPEFTSIRQSLDFGTLRSALG
jgi:Zn-dependent protease